jgi:hypothetical protein
LKGTRFATALFALQRSKGGAQEFHADADKL